MDRQRLERKLRERYNPSPTVARVVSREAQDLADSGRITEDFGYALTVEDVLSNVADAPDTYSLAERWNWWIDSLDLSHGGYRRFRIREDVG